jgi:hypothetical protein
MNRITLDGMVTPLLEKITNRGQVILFPLLWVCPHAFANEAISPSRDVRDPSQLIFDAFPSPVPVLP